MSNLTETKNINHLMFWEWHPVIMYNHHQTGPAGTVIFSPPFRDPFNYNFDPMIVMGLDMVGAAMHQRFLEENKPGFTMRSGSNYSTWWNGGLRTIGYFQGIIGILTEIDRQPDAGANSVHRRAAASARRYAGAGRAAACGTSASRSTTRSRRTTRIFDLASRYRETFLYNKYLMAKHAIEKGNKDQLDGERQGRASAQLRSPRHRRAQAGAPGGGRGGRGGRGARGRRAGARCAGGGRRSAAAARAPRRRCAPTTTCSTPRTSAIRAATSFRPISRISSRRSKFVNTLRHVGVYVDQATAAVLGGRQAVSGKLVRHQDGAGRARARARHDGAAGSPERLCVSGRSAAPSVRQRRLDARV